MSEKVHSFRNPFIQVRSNGLIMFEEPPAVRTNLHDLQQHQRERYQGIMTEHARRRLTAALDVMIQRNPKRTIYNPISQTSHDFSINFITLTLHTSKIVTPRKGYDLLLSKWLRYMKDKYDVKEYLWKCELTEAGQPHWHICTNQFIPWQVVRWKWNNLQRQERLLDKYALKHGHFNANSTDIHAVEEQDDVLRYVAKEVTKNTFIQVANGDPVKNVRWDADCGLYRGEMYEQCNPEYTQPVEWAADRDCLTFDDPGYKLAYSSLDCKVWDCADVLKRGRYSAKCDGETYVNLKRAGYEHRLRATDTDFCRIYKTLSPLSFLSTKMLQEWRTHIN